MDLYMLHILGISFTKQKLGGHLDENGQTVRFGILGSLGSDGTWKSAKKMMDMIHKTGPFRANFAVQNPEHPADCLDVLQINEGCKVTNDRSMFNDTSISSQSASNKASAAIKAPPPRVAAPTCSNYLFGFV